MRNTDVAIFSYKNLAKTLFAFLILIPSISLSAPLFYPGETLNPGCLPTDPDCTVSTSTTVGYSYASSTFPSFIYGSSTYYLASNPAGYLTLSTDPWMMASSSYLSTTSASNLYPTFTYSSSTFVNYSYSSSTFLTLSSAIADYVSTTTLTTNYPTFTYASSSFVNYGYASSTFASTSWITLTYVPYGYASSTFTTFNYSSSTFPTFTYASSTYQQALSLGTAGQFLISSSTSLTGYAWINGTSSIFSTDGVTRVTTEATGGDNAIRFYNPIVGFTSDVVPTMTSNTAPSGTSSASSVIADPTDYSAFKAFDDDIATMWHSAGTGAPFFLQYQFPTARTITKYELRPNNITAIWRWLDWQFQGSNNGSSWTTIDTQSGQSLVANQYNGYTVANVTPYTYYRFYITSTVSGTYATMQEVRLLETASAVANEVMTIVNNNVGIGTTSPAAKFEVYGTAGNYAIANFASSSNASALYIGVDGRVGVGTMSPTSNMQVVGSSDTSVVVNSSNLANFSRIRTTANNSAVATTFLSAGTASVGTVFGVTTANSGLLTSSGVSLAQMLIGTEVSAPVIFGTNNTARMTILAGGNVGIANTNPTYLLTIGGTGTKGFAEYDSSGGAIKTLASTLGANFGVQNTNASGFSGIEYLNQSGTTQVFTGFNNGNGQEFRFNNIASGGYIDFMIGSTPHMRIANSGNVGVGTTNPGLKFTTNGSVGLPATSGTTQNGALRIGNTVGAAVTDSGIADLSGTPVGWFQVTNSSNLASVYDLLINPNGGNVGVGTTSFPQVKLAVYGTAGNNAIANFASSSNESVLYIGANSFVGIGTTSPTTALYVNGTSTSNHLNVLGNIITDTSTFIVDSTNNRVGLGRTNPATRLDILGTSASVETTLQITGNGISAFLLGQDSNGGVLRAQGGNNSITFKVGGSPDTAAGTGGTEIMRLFNGGDVAIGVTSTSGRLTIQGSDNGSSTRAISILNSNGSSVFAVKNSGDVIAGPIYGTFAGASTTELVGEWLFDNTGNPTEDTSSFAATSTVSGPTYLSSGGVDGQGAYSVNGTSGHNVRENTYTASQYDIDGGKDMSISIWIKPGVNSGDSMFFKIGNPDVVGQSLFLAVNGSVIRIGHWGSDLNTSVGYTQDVWQHFVFSYTGGTYTIYKNGVLAGTLNHTKNLGATTLVHMVGSNTHAYNGLVDNVRLYSRTLDSTEVTNLYSEGALAVSDYAFKVNENGVTVINQLGLGTTTPQARLDVYGTAGNNAIANFASSSNASVLYIAATSKIGIGTTTPTANLTIEGTPTSTLLRLVNIGAGSLESDADGNIINTSDERLKDIQGEYEKGLAEIKQLTPINYRWKAETGLDASTTYSGFSAQNVNSVLPEATGKNGAGFLTLNERPIIAALVNAVKQIGSFIDKIEGGIAYLKDIVVEKFTVGSSAKPSGITMYDEITNQAYCIKIKNGIFLNEPGECSTNINNTASVSIPVVDTVIETSTTTEEISTTTEEVIVETTSTTTEVIIPEETVPVEIFLDQQATTTDI